MTWLNPWAWLGIGTLALPVLVHLLARNRARLRRLATLRFVEASPPTSTRPSRITDPLLLLVRLLVLAVAVAALARPSLRETPGSALGQEPPLTRVILVDAGPSMSRLTPDGEPAIDEARRRARDGATSGIAGTAVDPETGAVAQGAQGPARAGATYVIEVPGASASLAGAAEGAAAYLESVPGRREILVYSVVGAGALTPGVERARRLGIRVTFEQIAIASPQPDTMRVRHPASESRVWVMAAQAGGEGEGEGGGGGSGIRAGWDRTAPSPAALDSLRQAGTAYLAAEFSASPSPAPGAPVTLALGADALPGGDRASDWTGIPEGVGDLLLALHRDPGLGALARDAEVESGTWDRLVSPSGAFPPAMVAVRAASGQPAVLAVPVPVADATDAPGVLIASSSDPDAFLSSALVAAVGRGAPAGHRLHDSDPRVHSPEEVAAWNARLGGDAPVAASDMTAGGEVDPAEGSGEARLLWGVVLLLLTAEWRLRLRSGGDSR